jgi:hypothetical protein
MGQVSDAYLLIGLGLNTGSHPQLKLVIMKSRIQPTILEAVAETHWPDGAGLADRVP